MKIAVTGGKGGTGKTTVSVSLATLLASQGKVLIADADVECPNVHLLLSKDLERGTRKEVVRTFLPIIDEVKCTKCKICRDVCYEGAIIMVGDMYPMVIPESCSGCRACQIACPEKAILDGWQESGDIIYWTYEVGSLKLDAITGRLFEGKESPQPVMRTLKEKVEELANSYEHVIIDTPAGTGVTVSRALEGADLAVAVTEPTPMGYEDLKRILELTDVMRIPKVVIINRSDLNPALSSHIREELSSIGVRVVGEIPYSRELYRAYLSGIPPVLFSEHLKVLFEGILKEVLEVVRHV